MTPHKHAELIKAWADGAEIQYRYSSDTPWVDTKKPMWELSNEYRIKPKTIKYRLCLVKGASPYIIAVNEGADLDHFSHGKWIGDWQEVEI